MTRDGTLAEHCNQKYHFLAFSAKIFRFQNDSVCGNIQDSNEYQTVAVLIDGPRFINIVNQEISNKKIQFLQSEPNGNKNDI